MGTGRAYKLRPYTIGIGSVYNGFRHGLINRAPTCALYYRWLFQGTIALDLEAFSRSVYHTMYILGTVFKTKTRSFDLPVLAVSQPATGREKERRGSSMTLKNDIAGIPKSRSTQCFLTL